MSENPIFERYFRHASMLTSKTFDNPRSIIFRKHQAMWNVLADAKPSSVPTSALVERVGERATHHVLWLCDDGAALHESNFYLKPRRAREYIRKNETAMREYLNKIHRVLGRLYTACK